MTEACGASQGIEGGDWRTLGEGQIDLAFGGSRPLIWLKEAVAAIAAPSLEKRIVQRLCFGN